MSGGWWVLRGNPEGKEEEGSDFRSKCLGQTWGYVRHCNGGAGTMEQFLWNNLIPVSICHLMHSRDFVSYHYYSIFLHYPDPQGVTHTHTRIYIFLPIVYITYITLFCSIVRDPASYYHRWQWTDWWCSNGPIIISHLRLFNKLHFCMDGNIHTRALKRCNTLDGNE